MRRGIAGQYAGMHRNTRPSNALHVRHRRAAVDVGACILFFWMTLNTPIGVV